jgi:hypothetical protein
MPPIASIVHRALAGLRQIERTRRTVPFGRQLRGNEGANRTTPSYQFVIRPKDNNFGAYNAGKAEDM